MTILAVFDSVNGLVRLTGPHRHAHVGAVDYHVRVVAKQNDEPYNRLGVVVGDEGEFTTWLTANPGAATTYGEIANVPDATGDDWRDSWHLINYPYPGLPRTTDPGVPTDPLHALTLSIESIRHSGYVAIDQKTRALVAPGFEYPAASGQMFSLSPEAQRKWTAMYTARGFLAYPMVVTTTDEQDDVSLADSDDITAFFTAMVETVRTHIDGGRALKNTLRDATLTTEDEALTAIADGR